MALREPDILGNDSYSLLFLSTQELFTREKKTRFWFLLRFLKITGIAPGEQLNHSDLPENFCHLASVLMFPHKIFFQFRPAYKCRTFFPGKPVVRDFPNVLLIFNIELIDIFGDGVNGYALLSLASSCTIIDPVK